MQGISADRGTVLVTHRGTNKHGEKMRKGREKERKKGVAGDTRTSRINETKRRRKGIEHIKNQWNEGW